MEPPTQTHESYMEGPAHHVTVEGLTITDATGSSDPSMWPTMPPGDQLPDIMKQTEALKGMYSSSGFDMIGVLSRLVNRPNPKINLGPIDMSCSFLVTDANQPDCPIVYFSPNFETLTGYKGSEILGRNCRFLQAPDGCVTQGSIRKYAENDAVYHLKSYLMQNQEHQACILNYRKGGHAFVNLVTVIPIFNDANQVEFFIGLQVDLVEQPNAILERMRDGTYAVNYQQMNIPPYIPSSTFIAEPVSEYFREIPNSVGFPLADPSIRNLLNCPGENEMQIQQEWCKLVLNKSQDFIHVLSLKGFFLYCSPACSSILGYDPEELVGHSLNSICHPSDVVAIMREIKSAASDPEKTISVLYRIRSKYSGYLWIECQGKLHMDSSKGRKCLIMTGRTRPVYRLVQKEVANANAECGVDFDSEFWAKITFDGLFLFVTPTVENVLAYAPSALANGSLYRYIGDPHSTNITRSLQCARDGHIVNLTHTMRTSRGNHIQVMSTFYPGDILFGVGRPTFALMQTRLVKGPRTGEPKTPMFADKNENIFPELETLRGTSWQYELHQLEIENKNLRQQIADLSDAIGQKQTKKKKKPSPTEPSPEEVRMCAHCQCTDSPEWRKGPNGPKELCNACGLRYAKMLATGK